MQSFSAKKAQKCFSCWGSARTPLTVLPQPLAGFWRRGTGWKAGRRGWGGEVKKEKGGERKDLQQKFDKSSTGPESRSSNQYTDLEIMASWEARLWVNLPSGKKKRISRSAFVLLSLPCTAFRSSSVPNTARKLDKNVHRWNVDQQQINPRNASQHCAAPFVELHVLPASEKLDFL